MKVLFTRAREQTLPLAAHQDAKIEVTSTTDEESDRSSPFNVEDYVKSFAAFAIEDATPYWEANFDEAVIPSPIIFPDDALSLTWSSSPHADATSSPLHERTLNDNPFFLPPVAPDDDRDDIHLLIKKEKTSAVRRKLFKSSSRKNKYSVPEHKAGLLSSEHDCSAFEEKYTGYDVDILDEIPEDQQDWELEKLKFEGTVTDDDLFPIIVEDDPISDYQAPRTTLKGIREVHRATASFDLPLDCELSTIDEATVEDDDQSTDGRVTLNSSQSTVSFTVDFFSQPNFLNLSQDSSLLLDRDWAVPIDPYDIHEV